jgi:hypothetical protein
LAGLGFISIFAYPAEAALFFWIFVSYSL